ncbi:hypothetical protein [Pseudidiomarina terrestris]|uniref:hypothetical protein n=1 Tax=Pseudidiomarina terrestris TaxID=2820060 RepID=UPI00264D3307|nr:hypothetical protein [Pseudidiomarina sp. 1ASP75-5]MDN7134737.1 hypothetical protein [Pseudidiomarina sp. 1ASP75-5]
MIAFSLCFMLFSEVGVQAAPQLTPEPLQEQLRQVSELRNEELAELRAAARVRKLQHELQVAQLRHQISALDQPDTSAQLAEAVPEHPLAALELLSVVRSGEQISIWLEHAQQRFSVQPERSNAYALDVRLQANRLTLKQDGHERTFYLQGEW